jgi:methionyl-tRNA formyltransferase
MTKLSKTLVFFGSGPVAADSLAFLVQHFNIEAVVTKPVPPHHKDPAPVEEYAQAHNLKILYATNRTDLDNLVNKIHFASPVGVIVDFGIIVSQKVICTFPLGIVNSHFSLLPQWRGADPITASILSGQPKTGVSLMVIEPTLDTGKLITYKSTKINPTDTTPSLTKRLINLSNTLLADYLPRYINGQVKPKKQPHPLRATYSKKILKTDGAIDWNKPAGQIEQEIRAYIGWPGSYTTIGNLNVVICQAQVVSKQLPVGKFWASPSGEIFVGCSTDSLQLLQIKPHGKRCMNVKDLLNGYKSQLKLSS